MHLRGLDRLRRFVNACFRRPAYFDL